MAKRKKPRKSKIAATKRKPQQRSWKPQTRTTHRKTMGDGPFTRVVAAPSSVPDGVQPNWRAWGSRRSGNRMGAVPEVAPGDFDAMRAQSILDDLVRHAEYPPHLAAQLAAIDPDGTYVAVFTVQGGSGKGQTDGGEVPAGRGGSEQERRIVIVGRGRRVWTSAMGIAGHEGEVVDVEIHRAAVEGERDEAFPLWRDGVVEIEGGATIAGTGQRALWEATRPVSRNKGGAKKKSGGGMTSAERRRRKNLRAQKRSREKKTDARVASLLATNNPNDRKKAQALLRRSRAATFGHAKPRKKKR